MADYHAVLLRTLEGLGETTPQLRAKLYERARITIGKQLESSNPPMAAEAIATQKAHLEAAIASIESEYPSPGTPPATAVVPSEMPIVAEPVPTPASSQATAPSPPPVPAQVAQGTQIPRNLPSAAAASAVPPPPAYDDVASIAEPVPEIYDELVEIPVAEDEFYEPAAGLPAEPRSGRFSTMIMVVVGLLIVGGGATALWANRTSLSEAYDQLVSKSGTVEVAETSAPVVGSPEKNTESSESSPEKSDNGLAASTTVAATAVEKYDQRLNAEGQEVTPAPIPENSGTLPAGLEPSPVTTTRIVVPESNETSGEQPVIAQGTPTQTPESSATNSGPVIAQKGFLYEEGSSRGKNTVDVGSVVWSVVQEAPGEGMPLEPAIRAKVEIGGRGLVLLVTIKRNADAALPASHLIELVFSVPDDFVGGTIDKVQRFVFKESEEARGEALVGVPATIADGIFLIALNNLPQAVERNTILMKGREWIDIPLGYRTGRRALITLEKGVPGERVFEQVFAVWDKAG